jgi:hypothetical protein
MRFLPPERTACSTRARRAILPISLGSVGRCGGMYERVEGAIRASPTPGEHLRNADALEMVWRMEYRLYRHSKLLGVETASTLYRAGETVLTLEALAKHALKPAQRLKLETEARTGEFKIEEAKKESERELQRLLVRPSTVPMSSSPSPLSSHRSETPNLSAKGRTTLERAGAHLETGRRLRTSGYCTHLSLPPRALFLRKICSQH